MPLLRTGKEGIFEVFSSLSSANNNGNYGMCLNYPHNSGPGGCCGFDQPSNELANSFQVDANGLPYLNFEYRQHPEKPVTYRKISDNALSENDNSNRCRSTYRLHDGSLRHPLQRLGSAQQRLGA